MASESAPAATPSAAPASFDGARPPRSRLRRLSSVVAAPLIVLALLLFANELPTGSGLQEGGVTRPVPSAVGISPSPPSVVIVPEPSVPAEPSPSSARPTPSTKTTRSAPPSVGEYLLIERATLELLPTAGPAWDALVAIADESLGSPDLTDQDSRHAVQTLGVALVHARTGGEAYREKARRAIMDAIGTERDGADNSILALGRQLAAYVLAADLIGLSGSDDETFREWLAEIRTHELGGHGRWRALTATHGDSANNWGAFAGASRIAASLYLGDHEDVWAASDVLRGFLGDRTAWDAFQPVGDSADWACEPGRFVPVNPPCTKDGVDLSGAIVRDISRGGRFRWPPGEDGVRYTLESLQGLTIQAELLRRNGYGDPWSWSDDALRRAADFVTRSGQAGGDTWNRSWPSYHVPWLINARYGLSLPVVAAEPGRIFGYTDWLYGSR